MLIAAVLSAWVQFAADGAPHARALVTTACPALRADGARIPMRMRAPIDLDRHWDEAVCDAPLPPHAKALAVDNTPLPAVPRTVRTIVVFGDTGCRMKGGEQQNCGDLANWPFARIARSIAHVHPDVAIHVGDYYYRENNCAPGIQGCINYWGDTSMSWVADWFVPAAPIFARVPLLLSRGNHEDCKRGGAGWYRYLEPSAATACADPVPVDEGTMPYAVAFDRLRVVMLDSASDASDTPADPARTAYYQRALDAAAALGGGGEGWIVTHRPPYANANMTAVLKAKPAEFAPFTLVLAGHVHDFATANLTGFPPLIVNGEGGDDLDEAGTVGEFINGNGYAFASPAPFATKQFGFAVYTRTAQGWSISLRDADGIERRACAFAHGAVGC